MRANNQQEPTPSPSQEGRDQQKITHNLPITSRTKIRRVPQRGNYDRETIYQILDEGLICHIGFIVNGQPFVIPTAYGRIDDRLYLHGSPASRLIKTLKEGVEICVTITLLDGLVLARSAYHHSMNYRSVVVFGIATVVEDETEKLAALQTFTEHIIRDRWQEVRSPNPNELAGTLVLSLPLTEASAKMRSGPPIDDKDDYNLPVWAGEIPLSLQTSAPVVDPHLPENIGIPAYVKNYSRGTGQ